MELRHQAQTTSNAHAASRGKTSSRRSVNFWTGTRLVMAGCLSIGFMVTLAGCAAQLPDATDSTLASSSSISSIYVSVPLSTLGTGSSMLLTATGGTAPYTYSISGSSDSTVVAATGQFTAGATAGSVVVLATDSVGATGYGTVTVIGAGTSSTTATSMSFAAGNFTLAGGSTKTLADGSHLNFQQDGNLVFYDASNTSVWASNTAGMNCSSGCRVTFDGNFAIYMNNVVVWNTGTSGSNLTLSKTSPYIQVTDAGGNVQWSTNNTSGKLSQVIFTGNTLEMNVNQKIYVNGGFLILQGDGNLVMNNSASAPVTSTQSGAHTCNGGCRLDFQSDGNLVLYQNGTSYFSSGTVGQGAYFVVSNTSPYLQILNASGAVIWYR